MNQGTVGQYHVQRQHGIARDAVLGAAQPTSVRGDVPTNRGNLEACRVRGKHQPMHGHGSVELAVDDAGFNAGNLIGRVNLQDLVHARQVQHHAAGSGVRPARHPGPGTSGHQRNADCSGRTHNCLHIFHRFRPHHRQRQLVVGDGPLVNGKGRQICGGNADLVRAQVVPQ